MPHFKLPSVPPNSPAQPPSPSTPQTPLKETNNISLFRSLSSRSRTFLSSPSPTSKGRNERPRKNETPSPILRQFSDSLAKIPNILPKSPRFQRSPKAETPQHRRTRTYTISGLRKTQTLDPAISTSQDFQAILISEPHLEAALNLKRTSTHSGAADGRPPFLGDHISFSKSNLFSFSSERTKAASFGQANKASRAPLANRDQEREQAIPSADAPPRDALHTQEYNTRDRLLQIARFLQKAARHARDEGTSSQQSIFQASAPLMLFVFILGIGAFLPRYYSDLQSRLSSDLQTYFVLFFFGGALFLLLLLRAAIWVMSVLVNSFCEMDLATFSRGECIAVDGTRMGEGELVLWSFLFG